MHTYTHANTDTHPRTLTHTHTTNTHTIQEKVSPVLLLLLLVHKSLVNVLNQICHPCELLLVPLAISSWLPQSISPQKSSTHVLLTHTGTDRQTRTHTHTHAHTLAVLSFYLALTSLCYLRF